MFYGRLLVKWANYILNMYVHSNQIIIQPPKENRINTNMLSIFISRCAVLLCLVTQLCPTVCDPMDCSPPGPSIHGDSPGKNTGVGCHVLLQGIFPTQRLNPGLLHCRWILYQLSPGNMVSGYQTGWDHIWSQPLTRVYLWAPVSENYILRMENGRNISVKQAVSDWLSSIRF